MHLVTRLRHMVAQYENILVHGRPFDSSAILDPKPSELLTHKVPTEETELVRLIDAVDSEVASSFDYAEEQIDQYLALLEKKARAYGAYQWSHFYHTVLIRRYNMRQNAASKAAS